MFSVDDNVVFHSTSDARLDGAFGHIVGECGEGYKIVLFCDVPDGYNPAIVISESCLMQGAQ